MNQQAKPVIYIEDDANDALLMQIAFRRAGVEYPLIVLTDGQKAIEHLAQVQEGPASPCLLLLDLNLPRQNGFEVLEWVRAQTAYKDLPVIIFSSSEHEIDRQRSFKLGAADFVVKSARLDLLTAMAQKLNQRWLRHCAMESAA